MPSDNAIEIEFDEENRCYYIVWQPLIIGLGGTKFDTLKDVRKAAHFGVDTFIDLKVMEIGYDSNAVI